MAIGTPSTPAQEHKFAAPTGPKRLNRQIGHLHRDADAFLTCHPRSENMQTMAAPTRPAIRVPLRQLSLPFSSSPSAKRSQRHTLNSEDQSTIQLINRASDTSKRQSSVLNFARHVLPVESCFHNRHQLLPKEATSPSELMQKTETFKIFMDSEPMEIESTLNDLGSKHYVNDSMEIDADDDSMEVDTMVDMESLMDYIPMN